MKKTYSKPCVEVYDMVVNNMLAISAPEITNDKTTGGRSSERRSDWDAIWGE